MVGEACAEHADFAGSGDVDEVWAEAVEDFSDERDVAGEGGVEAEVFFEGEGEDAAGELEGPDGAVFDEGLTAVSGADAEEGEILAAGEGFEMAAGVRDAVDFVEGVREVRYSGWAGGHHGLLAGYESSVSR
jgi:hypothetical protein